MVSWGVLRNTRPGGRSGAGAGRPKTLRHHVQSLQEGLLLGYHSAWLYFVEIALLLAVAATPIFRAADSPPIPVERRVVNLDGLRGFAALSVFFNHAAVYHSLFVTGAWTSPGTRFYFLLGGLGVAFFFMITGYLFYSQLLRSHGKPDWRKLYIGRLFRILPLYWFAVALVLIGVLINTGFHLRVPAGQLVSELLRWSAGGLFDNIAINGYPGTGQIIAFVTWTLRFEWIFYASLIYISLLVTVRRVGLLFPPLLLVLVLLLVYLAHVANPAPLMCVALFSVGMSAAALKAVKPNLRIQGPLWSLAASGLLVFGLAFVPNAYRPAPMLLFGTVFVLITLGTDLFGLLSARASGRLGNISYGIYLLQGPVFAAVSSFSFLRALDMRSPLGHVAVTMLEALALIALATCTHVWIERPGIALGKRLLEKTVPQEK
jgi:peptidoglycan/LPS O-acetylase OafA/YrhL